MTAKKTPAKIIQVHYGKLWSLPNFSNERIGLTAQVEEGQEPDQVLAQLKGRVEEMRKIAAAEEATKFYQDALTKYNEKRQLMEEAQVWLNEHSEKIDADISKLIEKLSQLRGQTF